MLHFGKLIGRGVLAVALLLAAAGLSSGARAATALAQDDRYDIQLTTPFNLVREVDAVELDGFDTTVQRVAELKRRGIVTICYLNAGTSEDWRPDARDLPTAVIGRRYDGWAGEHWLDIRRWDILGLIVQRRLEMCKNKGFDGVNFDNLDGYAKRTGSRSRPMTSSPSTSGSPRRPGRRASPWPCGTTSSRRRSWPRCSTASSSPPASPATNATAPGRSSTWASP